MKRPTTLSLALLLAGTTSLGAQQPKRQPAPRLVPFTAMALFGQDVEILRHGPLTLLLQCRASPTPGRDAAIIAAVSTEDDTLYTGEPSILVPAGDDRTLIYGSIAADVGGGYVGATTRLRTSMAATCPAAA